MLACFADITKVVTPDLKEAESSVLVHVDMNPTRARLGGSALAQVHNHARAYYHSPPLMMSHVSGVFPTRQ
jgi:phosphoribosylformylglycinamidine (FGAM) synthase-like enzyme